MSVHKTVFSLRRKAPFQGGTIETGQWCEGSKDSASPRVSPQPVRGYSLNTGRLFCRSAAEAAADDDDDDNDDDTVNNLAFYFDVAARKPCYYSHL